MEGWVKLHRGLLEWEWYGDSNVMRVFIHILLKTNHKEKSWRGNTIKRGEFITSYDSLSKELGLTVKQIRTVLSKLKRTNEIVTKSNSKHTVIQIVNYNKYQTEDKPKGKQVANRGQTEGKQGATTKNEKKEENEKKEAPEIYRSFDHLKITTKEYDSLIEVGWSKEQINHIIDSIENYAKNKSYKSLYLTAKKWLVKEYDKPKPKEQQGMKDGRRQWTLDEVNKLYE